jgi:hypothetical protein
VDEPLGKDGQDWICGSAGRRSVDAAVLGAYCELYQLSTGPRAWTDEIDGSSSFTVLTGVRLRAQDIDFEEDPRENPRVYAQDSRACCRTGLTANSLTINSLCE